MSEDIAAMSLELGSATAKFLFVAGITSFEQLRLRSVFDVYKIPGIGRRRGAQIREAMRRRGTPLRSEYEWRLRTGIDVAISRALADVDLEDDAHRRVAAVLVSTARAFFDSSPNTEAFEQFVPGAVAAETEATRKYLAEDAGRMLAEIRSRSS